MKVCVPKMRAINVVEIKLVPNFFSEYTQLTYYPKHVYAWQFPLCVCVCEFNNQYCVEISETPSAIFNDTALSTKGHLIFTIFQVLENYERKMTRNVA